MATAAQIAANRRNALLARGPKTTQGKRIARSNSLKHGLTGAGVVLLPEDREAFERRRAEWGESLGVGDDRRQFLLDRAALASVRLDRCVTIESARLAKRAGEAERRFDRQQSRRARALGARLEDDRDRSLSRLRGFAAGCRWILGQWGAICEQLDQEQPLDDASRQRCRQLLPGESTWLADFGDDPEARRELREVIDAEVMVLEILRDRFAAEDEAPAREQARTLALFDPTDEAARLAKYEASHESILHRSFHALERRPRADRRPDADFEPEIDLGDGENEPNSAAPAVQNEPNPGPIARPRPMPRPVRDEPKPRRVVRFAVLLLIGLLAGRIAGGVAGAGPRRNSWWSPIVERFGAVWDGPQGAVASPAMAPGEAGTRLLPGGDG